MLDLIGQRFGKLVVLEYSYSKKQNRYWLCQCDCGNKIHVKTSYLTKNEVKSCGCLRHQPAKNRKDIQGQKFGRLLVIRPIKLNFKDLHWECQCDCGNLVVVAGIDLRNGHTQSCGCFNKEIVHQRTYKGTKDISGRYFGKIQISAKSRGLNFDLTIEFLQQLLEDQDYKCAISGIPICGSQNTNKNHSTYQEMTASLDRIDSSKDYIENNVHWVHKDINIMKLDHTQEEFVQICHKISDYQRKSRVKKVYRYV